MVPRCCRRLSGLPIRFGVRRRNPHGNLRAPWRGSVRGTLSGGLCDSAPRRPKLLKDEFSMNLLALIQEGAEHAAETAEGGGGNHEAISPITQAVNAVLGPVALAIENAVMPPLYNLLGLHWTPPDAHEAIPQHVVMAVISLLICTVGLKLLMGK